MLKFTLNGKTIMPEDFEKELMKSVAQSVAQEMRERLSAIRHPDTGEFPTIVINGDTLDDMSFRVEGSTELLALVKERMSSEELTMMQLTERGEPSQPRVFLSYASEDSALAEKIARGLIANGIDTWWDKWEIRSGDSLRQKIEQGIGECTHFIVLLTPNSIIKPWVNLEIDAGLVRRVGEQSIFIPLRHDLPASKLSPLLAGMRSPEVDGNGSNLQQLVNDIHGIHDKPALGPAPQAGHVAKTGYSAASSAIAAVFVKRSENATFGDPQLNISGLMDATYLSEEDVVDALHEIRGMVKVFHDHVLPEDELYATFDKFWMEWDPAQDALRLAADMLNDATFPSSPAEITARYGWQPRRLNPAIAYLMNRDMIRGIKALDSHPYVAVHVQKTDATRRFVRSRA